MSRLWVGVDLGTQSAKVSVVDDFGQVHASASAPLTSSRAGRRHEQDPTDWIRQVRAAMAAALGTLDPGTRNRLAGVAICATSGTITTVDDAGSPLSTGLMYDDARAGALSEEVAAVDPERWKRLGYRIQPTWALPKILWLHRAGALAEGAHVAHQADVAAGAMIGGPVASDWSHSLKSGYDLLELEWPNDALESLGIDPAVMPPVVAPGTVLGHSSAAWAADTDLPAGTPIFAGMTDGCAAQLGAATLGPGDWHTVIGTTLVVKGVSDRIVVDDTGAIYSHRAPHDGLWFPGGASSVGAGAISTAFPGEALSARTARLSTLSLSDVPLSYPLIGVGERFPVVQPEASGFLIVDGADVSLADAASRVESDVLFASILLGIACVERLSVETMAAAGVPVGGTFSSSGGGTRNPWWNRLRADLLGRSIAIPSSSEGSIGMAILAAWAGGSDPLPSVAARMSPIGEIVEPDSTRGPELDDHYGAFRSSLVSRGWLAP